MKFFKIAILILGIVGIGLAQDAKPVEYETPSGEQCSFIGIWGLPECDQLSTSSSGSGGNTSICSKLCGTISTSCSTGERYVNSVKTCWVICKYPLNQELWSSIDCKLLN